MFSHSLSRSKIHSPQRGFSYIALLIVLAVFALASSQVASLGAVAQRRVLEQDLLWVGTQYARAIQSYVDANPNAAPGRPSQYPQKLDDLLRDNRFPNVRRHLRKLYPDPLSGKEWGLVTAVSIAPQAGILGVYSMAEGAPIKQTGFADAAEPTSSLPNPALFENRSGYKEWVFGYTPLAAGLPNNSPNPAVPARPTSQASAPILTR